ncbi:hypothetical protein KA047_01910 [Candidatus Saccharibacteria bacterium]|nr:hypothetical protein [Candidatus Saccharibacteria bacterium]
MKNMNQRGFTAIEIVLIVAVVGLIGGIGWFVWDRNNTKKSESTTTSSQQSSQETATTDTTSAEPVYAELPNDFTEFKVDQSGIRLGYPTVAGEMKSTSASSGAIYLATTPDTYNKENKWQGSFSLDIYTAKNFTYTTGKYGVTIKPQGDKWIVTKVNPAVEDYKVGDTYKMDEKKINGGVAYEFTDNDESAPVTSWVIKLKAGYAVVSLPKLTTTDLIEDPVTEANRKAYTQLSEQVLASFTVF